MLEILIAGLVLFSAAMLLLYRRLWAENRRLKFSKQSLSTKYGKMTEQFMPFLKQYPYDENNFRFLGTPVDGVQFEDDKIVFVEFKAADSKLSERQKKVKDLVERKKVGFEEVRI